MQQTLWLAIGYEQQYVNWLQSKYQYGIGNQRVCLSLRYQNIKYLTVKIEQMLTFSLSQSSSPSTKFWYISCIRYFRFRNLLLSQRNSLSLSLHRIRTANWTETEETHKETGVNTDKFTEVGFEPANSGFTVATLYLIELSGPTVDGFPNWQYLWLGVSKAQWLVQHPSVTARVNNSQNVDILAKVYPVHLKVEHCQTLRVVSTFTG